MKSIFKKKPIEDGKETVSSKGIGQGVVEQLKKECNSVPIRSTSAPTIFNHTQGLGYASVLVNESRQLPYDGRQVFDESSMQTVARFIIRRNALLVHFISPDWGPSLQAGSSTASTSAQKGKTHEPYPEIGFHERGTLLLHLLLASNINPTALIKTCTMNEMMKVGKVYETAFRSDSVHTQVIFEFWRLAFVQYLPEWTALQTDFLSSFTESPIEIDQDRPKKLGISDESIEPFLKDSCSRLMKFADRIIQFLNSSLDFRFSGYSRSETKSGPHSLCKTSSSLSKSPRDASSYPCSPTRKHSDGPSESSSARNFVDSLAIVCYFVSQFTADKMQASQIIASTVYLRVVSAQIINSVPKEAPSSLLRSVVLLGRLVQCCANGTSEFRHSSLNTFVDVAHSSIMRCFNVLPDMITSNISESNLLRFNAPSAYKCMRLIGMFINHSSVFDSIQRYSISESDLQSILVIFERQNSTGLINHSI